VVVAKDGKLIYEKYYNGFDENSQHDTRSATKTVTSMLIGIAIDKGFIKSEKETFFHYFRDKYPVKNPDLRKVEITIEDLLTMSSAVECNDDNQFSRGNEERMYIIEDYFKFYLDLPIRGKPPWEDDIKDLPYQRRFSYCTAGTVLLGGIIERSTKMKVEDFAQKYLFEPLGIVKPTWQFIPDGTAMTGGGLRLKARDFIKLGQLYLDGGKFKGKQIISSEWVTKSIKPYANTGSEIDYGYLWWLPKYGQKDKKYSAYAMFGNGGNKIAVFPKLNIVVVLPNRMYGQRQGHEQTEKILNEYIIPTFAEN
jgi:CubicO group peptidase (beta-lactamase class C family)